MVRTFTDLGRQMAGVPSALALAVALLWACAAWGQPAQSDFLHEFLPGSYQLIGTPPDRTDPYLGRMVIERTESSFHIVREANGDVIEGVGSIAFVTPDRIPVLRVRFALAKIQYEVTYVIGSDLDNFPRLTGYVYRVDGKTASPGIEAAFAEVGARKAKDVE